MTDQLEFDLSGKWRRWMSGLRGWIFGPTPLGEGVRYDALAGEMDLIDPVSLPQDERIREVCKRFADMDARGREAMRTSLTSDDFNTLMVYCRRAAAFAIREGQIKYLSEGLTAMAMIKMSQIDRRDVMSTLGVLYGSYGVIGTDARELFRIGAALAEEEVARLFLLFAKRPSENDDLRKWGYKVVRGQRGIGLVSWWGAGEKYEPTCELDQMALAIGRLIERAHYHADVRLGGDLPRVWLAGIDNEALEAARGKIAGCASVSGKLRPEGSPNYKNQMLHIFLVETEDASTAIALVELMRKKREKATDLAMTGVQRGRAFCLVIGRSVELGRSAVETKTSILRFADGIEEILKEYVKDVKES